MLGKCVMWTVTFGCAVLFFAIGIYARKRQTPMGFWAGTELKASQLTDVEQYNRENALLWQRYSLWYFAAGLAEFWSTAAAAVLLALGGTVGIALLIVSYNRIFKKYTVQ
ncbi:MAG: hypothetical protein IJ412_06990 [Oscillospiraceae bacterium]|nr:hypothetical protein [Oscillospiraceae bacterium]